MTTLAAASASQLLVDLSITLLVAAAVTLGLKRVRIGAIPAYLIAGALIGPHALGLISDYGSVASISELAVIMLMFGIGLHMDLEYLRGGMLKILAAGLVSTVATVVIAAPTAMLFGFSAPAAVAVAMALSMSSTAVVLRRLMRDRELTQTHGRLAFGILITQDLLVIAFLALMPTLGVWAAGETGGVSDEPWLNTLLNVFGEACIAVGGIGLTIVLGRWLLPRLMELATKRADAELLLIVAFGAAFGAAVLTSRLGFSPELGAFLAGFLLAPTVFRHQIEGQLAPVRDLFMAIFFVAVGLGLNLSSVAPVWWQVLLAIPLLLIIKTITIGVSSWVFGAPGPTALRTGITLSQSGEFTLIVLAAAVGAGVLGDAEESKVVAIVVTTLILTPMLVIAGKKYANAAVKAPHSPLIHREMGSQTSEDHDAMKLENVRGVIIAGFGPVGRSLAQRLELRNVPYTIVDLNTATITKQTKLGRRAVYGDVTNPSVLASAGIETADAVAITIPDDEAMLRAVRAVKERAPHVLIAARANLMSKGLLARQAGAELVTVEEVAAAEAMTADVLRELEKRCADPAEDADSGHPAAEAE